LRFSIPLRLHEKPGAVSKIIQGLVLLSNKERLPWLSLELDIRNTTMLEQRHTLLLDEPALCYHRIYIL
jgi:hypothetical protein